MEKSGGVFLKLVAFVVGIALTSLSLGIGAYIGSLYSPDDKQYHAVGSPAGAEDNYIGPSESLPDIAGIAGTVERIIANPPPESGEDHERRDLAAQEAMAVWAFWMVLVSAITGIVSAAGLLALLKTISQNKEAIAKAHDANQIARSQLASELVVSAINVNIHQYFGLSISLKNTGSVKARQIRLSAIPKISVKIPASGLIPFTQNEVQFGPNETENGLIQAGHEAKLLETLFYYDKNALTIQQMLNATEIHRGILIFIVGEIEWTDQLNEGSKIGFHAVLNPVKIGGTVPITINEYQISYFEIN